MSKAWSSGERVGKAPLVARPSLLRRLRDAIDWGFARWALGLIATGLVLLHVAIGRS